MRVKETGVLKEEAKDIHSKIQEMKIKLHAEAFDKVKALMDQLTAILIDSVKTSLDEKIDSELGFNSLKMKNMAQNLKSLDQ